MDFENPPENPLPEIEQWLATARRDTDLPNPNAMTLATVDRDGQPSARTVLLRGLDERGAVFFTNYTSRKGNALDAHGRAALLFHWDVLERQLRIEGTVTRVSDEESDAYFASRRRESQIGAWASPQSRPLVSRAVLERLVERFTAKFDGEPVPRPPHWGGYRVALDHVEFWQGHPHRLHDRVAYMEKETVDGERLDGWMVTRLAP